MSANNGIKVSRGFTEPDEHGAPIVGLTTLGSSGTTDDRTCVVVWADDFAALEADAKRAQEPKIKTPCPSCGSQSLFVPDHGLLTCSVIGCREPAMLNDMAMERRKQMETTNETPAPVFDTWLYVEYDGSLCQGTEEEMRANAKRYGDPRARVVHVRSVEDPTPAPRVPKVGERVLVVPLQVVGTVSKVVGPAYAMVDIDGVVRGYAVENLRPAPAPTPEPTGPEGYAQGLEVALDRTRKTAIDWKARAEELGRELNDARAEITTAIARERAAILVRLQSLKDADACLNQSPKLAAGLGMAQAVIRGRSTPEPDEPEVMHEVADESGGIGAGSQSSTTEAQIRAALSAFNRQGNGAAPEVTDREIWEAFNQTVLGILLAEDLIQTADLATLTPEQAVRNLVDEYDKTSEELATLREKLAAVERERDRLAVAVKTVQRALDDANGTIEAQRNALQAHRDSADHDREAREFEREAFLRLFVGYSVHMESLNNEAVLEWSKTGAAAARAAMFPGDGK